MMIIHWTKKSAEVLSFDLFYFIVADLIEYKNNLCLIIH